MKIAVASGKGGTGKTMVATNLFWVSQNKGWSTTIVDCDAEEPNVVEFVTGHTTHTHIITQHVPIIDAQKCTFCGRCFEYCNYNAIIYLPQNNFIQVVTDLCHDCGACTYACQCGAITEIGKKLGTVKTMLYNAHADILEACSEVGVYSPVPIIKNAISEAVNSEITILDSPPGISCPFIATVDRADYVVLVTEPTPFGLNDLKLSVETLQQMGKPFGVIVNRVGLGDNEVFNYLKKNSITLLSTIPFERDIARIYSEGKILAQSRSDYQSHFEDILQTIKNQISK
jgi:MinD superfamily P-loop ATPase